MYPYKGKVIDLSYSPHLEFEKALTEFKGLQ